MGRLFAVMGTSVAVLVFAFAPNAVADTFDYTTAGSFSISGNNIGNTLSFNDNSNQSQVDASLTFNGINPSVSTTQNPISLGTFVFNVADLGLSSTTPTASFGLDITFTQPAGVNGTDFNAFVSGNVTNSNGVVFINFNQTTLPIGSGYTLTLDSNPIIFNENSTGTFTDAVTATVNGGVSMPEGSGLAMLALCGIVTLGGIKKKARGLVGVA